MTSTATSTHPGTAPASAQTANPVDERLVPVPHRVLEVRRETADTITIALQPRTGRPPPFTPGQVDMLYAFGTGEVPISIASDPTETEHREYTIRRVGPVTRALTNVAPGDHLGVRGPFGVPWPVEEARGGDLVVVAGGIGIAPLRATILAALRERHAFGAVSVLYGARSPGDLVYRVELERWRARLDTDIDVTVDSAGSGWHGNVGLVTRLVPRTRFEPDRTTAFVCGPEPMMRYAAQALLERGVSAARIFVSAERNMVCGIGTCGHCQLGPYFLCHHGPVLSWQEIGTYLRIREL